MKQQPNPSLQGSTVSAHKQDEGIIFSFVHAHKQTHKNMNDSPVQQREMVLAQKRLEEKHFAKERKGILVLNS